MREGNANWVVKQPPVPRSIFQNLRFVKADVAIVSRVTMFSLISNLCVCVCVGEGGAEIIESTIRHRKPLTSQNGHIKEGPFFNKTAE